MDLELSVVIPAYNEEENIEPCYREITSALEPLGINYEIIFVDDGSKDSTFKELQNLSKNDNKLKVIKFRKNFGQSAALRAGLDHAAGRIIVTMDADLQNDPKDIPKLLEKLEKEDLDVVCGWRFDRKDPLSKKFVSKFANRLRTRFTGETIHDSGCTLRAYVKESTEDLELYGELHRYIPAMLSWKGYRIGEIKTNHRERKYGKTKYDWKRIVKGFLDLLVVTFWQKYSLRPIHIFGSMGIVLSFFGGIVSLYIVILRLFYGIGITDRPLFTVSVMSLVIGIQFFTIGILADILVKIYYGQNGRKNYLVERIIE
ncbi:TPA: glycosyltransferase family 2 protein [Methanosarcina acetivorans]|uniref:Glycosyltransferase group 2 family protein n=2 Tax=Methanosarcina acetivorans TaxID=2214 RepID=Q8TRJ1_METAC|nr:glycosyltransferase [Methanosarcina acetivorans]AAM04605.1 glycosyltransferase group 2 family protein [Methanosarcina acetivorans C2A]HIH94924.1 glycosyltransferase family 2 protein [Methanosarcina acetivorans]